MKLHNNPKNMMKHLFSFLLFAFAVASYSVHAANFVYISDNLRVGVRTEPVSTLPPIGVVFTGMRLEVQKSSDGYIKITTEDGLTGWIKDIYVTEKAPAIIELNAFRTKYEKLQKDLAQGNETISTLEKTNLTLSEQIEELNADKRDWAKERANLLASQHKESSWFWIIELIILVIVCFAAGAFWYRTQAMKRLGGLRV